MGPHENDPMGHVAMFRGFLAGDVIRPEVGRRNLFQQKDAMGIECRDHAASRFDLTEGTPRGPHRPKLRERLRLRLPHEGLRGRKRRFGSVGRPGKIRAGGRGRATCHGKDNRDRKGEPDPISADPLDAGVTLREP